MKKVLVLDPDEEIRNVMDILLKQYGYHTLLTNKYESVLPLIEKEKPKVIFLDVYSPYMCKSICTRIKRNEKLKETCIILFSTSDKIIKDHDSFNADAHLSKPFDINELLMVLDQCTSSFSNNA